MQAALPLDCRPEAPTCAQMPGPLCKLTPVLPAHALLGWRRNPAVGRAWQLCVGPVLEHGGRASCHWVYDGWTHTCNKVTMVQTSRTTGAEPAIQRIRSQQALRDSTDEDWD